MPDPELVKMRGYSSRPVVSTQWQAQEGQRQAFVREFEGSRNAVLKRGSFMRVACVARKVRARGAIESHRINVSPQRSAHQAGPSTPSSMRKLDLSVVMVDADVGGPSVTSELSRHGLCPPPSSRINERRTAR